MRFTVDAQLPLTLARWLRGRDIDAVHVLDIERALSSDTDIWDYALKEDRIVISKDEDFFILAKRPKDKGKLLWIRLGNCRTADLLSVLNKRWNEIYIAFENNQKIVEIR